MESWQVGGNKMEIKLKAKEVIERFEITDGEQNYEIERITYSHDSNVVKVIVRQLVKESIYNEIAQKILQFKE